LWQAEYIRARIEGLTGLEVCIKVIKTTGDKILDVPLAKVGGKGLFTKEIEVELEAGTVDLAVHSMKDVPTLLPEGLVIAAIPERVDPRDAIVSGSGYTLETLPKCAKVGTSSLRRVAQVRALRPDVEIVDVRGNLDTRMRKAETGELDAVVLAAAGITRLGWADRITHYIPTAQMVSAVGQGAIGVEIREDDALMQDVCARLTDPETMTCVTAERVVMSTLEGGCQVPIGAYARIMDGVLVMDGMVGSVDGSRILRAHAEGDPAESAALGRGLVESLLGQGAAAILAEVRDASVCPEPSVDPRLET
jgi:hydroxymethylbilane synthase